MLAGWTGKNYETIFDVRVKGSSAETFTGTAISASYITPTVSCLDGAGGTLTFDTYGPAGGRITGVFSGITGFLDPSGTCPDSVSGSFDLTREPDN